MGPDPFTTLWLLLMVVWMVGAATAKRTVRRETGLSLLYHGGLLAVGFLLLFKRWLPDARFVPDNEIVTDVGLAIAAAGIALAIWARLTIGRNWSGEVTIKQDHRLIRRGPYRVVRHPIYTGILLAMFGTAIGYGRLLCLAGVVVAFAALREKWKMEERFLIEQFGEEYRQYLREVKAVIPGVL